MRWFPKRIPAARDVYIANTQNFSRDAARTHHLDRDLLVPVGDLDAASPSQLLAARNRVIPFGHRDGELATLTDWRGGATAAEILLLHAAGGQGKTRLADHFLTLSRGQGWRVAAARHITEAIGSKDRDQLDGAADDDTLLVVDYADRWPVADLLRLSGEALTGRSGRVRILLLARSAGWWSPVRHELREQGWRTEQHHLRSIEPDIPSRRRIYADAVTRFAEVIGVPAPDPADQDLDFSSSGYDLALSLHMAALATVLAESEQVPAPADPPGASAYLLDRERAYWRRLLDAGTVSCGSATIARAVFSAVLAGPLRYDEAVRLLELTGVSSATAPAGVVVDDHRVCYPPNEPSLVLEPLYPDRLAEDFVALQIPATAGHHESDPWTDSAVRKLINNLDELPPEAGQRVLLVLVEVGRRWPHVADHVVRSFDERPALALRLGGAGLLRLVTTDSVGDALLARLDDALPAELAIEFDVPRSTIAGLLLASRLAATDDLFHQADLIADFAILLARTGESEGALEQDQRALKHLEEHADRGDGRYFPSYAGQLISVSGRLSVLERFPEARDASASAVRLYRMMESTQPGSFAAPLAAALNNYGMALLRCGDIDQAVPVVEEAVHIREELVARTPGRFEADLAASLDNLSLVYTELGEPEMALAFTQRAVDIFRDLTGPHRTGLDAELAAALDNLGGSLSVVGRRDESLAAIEESVGLFQRLAEANPKAFDGDLLKAMENLARALWDFDRSHESIDYAEQAITLREKLAERSPLLFGADLTYQLIVLGLRLMDLDNYADAARYLRQALARGDRGTRADVYGPVEEKAFLHDRLSVCLAELDDPDAALAASLRSVAIWETTDLTERDHAVELGGALKNLSLRYGEKARLDDAVAAAERSMTILRSQRLDDPGQLLDLGTALGAYAMACATAETALDAALDACDESTQIFYGLGSEFGDAEMAAYIVAAQATKVQLLELTGRQTEADDLAGQLALVLGEDPRG